MVFRFGTNRGFAFCFGLNPARIGGVAAGFDGELAHKAKHGETASETKSQPKEKGFLGFFLDLHLHRIIRGIRKLGAGWLIPGGLTEGTPSVIY